MWTSGSSFLEKSYDDSNPTGKKYHVIMTTSRSTYQQWQARVFYYWYKKQKELNPESDIGGFTRILHDYNDDQLSKEMPTVRVDPLDDNRGYVVLSRPFSFMNFIKDGYMDKIEEDYIMMAEPDHIFLKALPNFVSEEHNGICFPFFYIDPLLPTNVPLMEKVLGRKLSIADIKAIAGTGSSPVIVKKDDFKKVVEKWHDFAMFIFDTPELKSAWGWVLEMWAFTLASFDVGVRYIRYKKFMLQPPWEADINDRAILHYTYGMDTDLEGNRILNGTVGPWHWDKRDFLQRPPQRVLDIPAGAPSSIHTLIKMVNEAIENTPTWEIVTEVHNRPQEVIKRVITDKYNNTF